MSDDRPTATCPTCGSPVTVEGDTTLHDAPPEPSGTIALSRDDIGILGTALALYVSDVTDPAGVSEVMHLANRIGRAANGAAGLTVDDVRRWAEVKAQKATEGLVRLGDIARREGRVASPINVAVVAAIRSTHRELAEALRDGELPHADAKK